MNTLDALLAEDRLTPAHMRTLAGALVARHADAPKTPDEAPGPDFFRGVIDALALRHDLCDETRKRLEAGLDEGSDLLIARAGRNRILAAADELAPGDISFADEDSVSIAATPGRDFGVPVDGALEVAGLSAWLGGQGRADLAEVLVSRYANEAEDFELYLVLDFYESFCALREAARAEAGTGDAEDVAPPPVVSARSPLTRPIVLAMSGPVASGKSTLARTLSDHLAAPLTVADRIRDHLVHGAPGRPVHEAGWAGGFEAGFGATVYAEMLARGETVLRSGRPVILDACFSTAFQRAAARALARRHGAPFLFVECRVTPEVQRQRLSERDAEWEDEPGAWAEIAADLAARFDPPTDLAAEERIEVNTSADLATPLEAVLARLSGPLLPRGASEKR